MTIQEAKVILRRYRDWNMNKDMRTMDNAFPGLSAGSIANKAAEAMDVLTADMESIKCCECAHAIDAVGDQGFACGLGIKGECKSFTRKEAKKMSDENERKTEAADTLSGVPVPPDKMGVILAIAENLSHEIERVLQTWGSDFYQDMSHLLLSHGMTLADLKDMSHCFGNSSGIEDDIILIAKEKMREKATDMVVGNFINGARR